jgi:hypothetical protein
MDAQSDPGEADCQDHEHREGDGDFAPDSTQDRQEYEEQHRGPDHCGLGVTAGKARPGFMGVRA